MKLHITNLYNFNQNDILVTRQHQITEAARSLGFLEMGIFSYPVETDTHSELSKRIDGIISALEFGDVVFMQLPTTNGYKYESFLFNKIKAYRTKVVLLIHDLQMIDDSNKELQEKYISLLRNADAVIAPSTRNLGRLSQYNLKHLLFLDTITKIEMCNNAYPSFLPGINFYEKKVLMDAIEAIYSNDIQHLQTPTIKDEIQIAFGLHDKTGNYSALVGTAMQSVLEHTSSQICFHIMHDNTLTEENRSKLVQIATRMEQRIIFHNINTAIFSDVEKRVQGFSIASMFRILLPELLPEAEKVIYLDADILVARDIKELWNTELSNYCLAAVPDMLVSHNNATAIPIINNQVEQHRYFNSGVLMLNLSNIRTQVNLLEASLQYLLNTPDTSLLDQDALNVIFKDSVLLLDDSWNYWASFVRTNNERNLEAKIYHYVGTRLHLIFHTDMDQLYYETLLRTPWGIEEGRKQLNATLGRITDLADYRECLIKQLCNKKKFIFYGAEAFSMKEFYKVIPPKKNDYRVLKNLEYNYGNILPCQDFSSLAKEKKGTFVVFYLPGADNNTAAENLRHLGLEEKEDFFNILRLLLPDKGGYM